MGADGCTHRVFVDALLAAGSAVIEAKEELTRLDAAAGDGDLGATMDRGFRAVREQLSSSPPETADMAVRQTGEILSSRAPSTMGTLFGAALMMAADSLGGRDELVAADVTSLLEVMGEQIAELGEAEVGQRTVLDALVPAAVAARGAVDEGETDPRVALSVAADAAEEGAKRTADMVATVGRARWTGDRSAGVVDGGARALAIWLRGLANGLTDT